MKLTGHPVVKFDRFLPIYNWLYPLSGRKSHRFSGQEAMNVFPEIAPATARALYLHIPFCETICTFCPFVRGEFRDKSIIESYVYSLVREINIKASYTSLVYAPIRSIFVGGGTPSLLEPHHIRRIGRTLRDHFDLNGLLEFSYEMEVKSVTADRIDALLDIGVTHARFGLQTFSPKYRRLFALTATLEQVGCASVRLRDAFPHVSCDLLYGMNGQTVDDLILDIERVCELGMNNIDFYPINNLVTQPKLHHFFAKEDMRPLSGLTKHYMNVLIREELRSHGFLPHNGHGYVRVPQEELARNPVVTNLYSFVYHEHVYGYPGYDLLGFGTNAVSSFRGWSLFNHASRSKYINALSEGHIPMEVAEHERSLDTYRPLCLALPYHGSAHKGWIDQSALPSSASNKVAELIAHGLVRDTGETLELTRDGWHWYSCVMYYLLPVPEQLGGRQDNRGEHF